MAEFLEHPAMARMILKADEQHGLRRALAREYPHQRVPLKLLGDIPERQDIDVNSKLTTSLRQLAEQG